MQELVKQVRQNIFFMGAIDTSRVPSRDHLEKLVARVQEDRLILLQVIFAADYPTRIEGLKFITSKRVEVKRKIQEKQETVTNLLNRNLEEKDIKLAKACGSEVHELRHIVSLFDAECLELYSKLKKRYGRFMGEIRYCGTKYK